MSEVKRNAVANFAGQGWAALIGLAVIPIYIRLMDVESYGLIGVFVMLQAAVAVLDLGVSATLTRELARRGTTSDGRSVRSMVRAFERFYWIVAIGIAVGLGILAPLLSEHWIQAQSLAGNRLENLIWLIGAVVAIQWPTALYSGGLVGQQRQVLLNAVLIGMATVRAAGAVAALVWIAPTIEVFFVWQGIIGLAHVLVLRALFLRPMADFSAQGEPETVWPRGVWRFAAGMGAISATALILTQMDRFILSGMLSLETFGYYSLATAVAAILYRLTGPVFSAVYPKLTQLVAVGDHDTLVRAYHQYCQSVSVLVFPATLCIVLFSRELLTLWTQDAQIASEAHVVLSLLATGTAMNCLMYVPYALQLAHGWTRLTLLTNIVSIVLLVPMLVLAVRLYGAEGAAGVWVVLNIGYLSISAPIMYRRLAPLAMKSWYVRDLGIPFGAAFSVQAVAMLIAPAISDPVYFAGLLIGATLVAVLASALAAPEVRPLVVERLRNRLQLVS